MRGDFYTFICLLSVQSGLAQDPRTVLESSGRCSRPELVVSKAGLPSLSGDNLVYENSISPSGGTSVGIYNLRERTRGIVFPELGGYVHEQAEILGRFIVARATYRLWYLHSNCFIRFYDLGADHRFGTADDQGPFVLDSFNQGGQCQLTVPQLSGEPTARSVVGSDEVIVSWARMAESGLYWCRGAECSQKIVRGFQGSHLGWVTQAIGFSFGSLVNWGGANSPSFAYSIMNGFPGTVIYVDTFHKRGLWGPDIKINTPHSIFGPFLASTTSTYAQTEIVVGTPLADPEVVTFFRSAPSVEATHERPRLTKKLGRWGEMYLAYEDYPKRLGNSRIAVVAVNGGYPSEKTIIEIAGQNLRSPSVDGNLIAMSDLNENIYLSQCSH